MNIAQIAQARYTTKAFDPERKIPEAVVEQLCAVLRNAPSSVNSQPWHFIVAASPEAKLRVAKATQGGFTYNEPKLRNASHVIVLCGRTRLNDAHLDAVIAQENSDGRFATPEAMATQDKTRRFYVNLHQNEMKDDRAWIERQVYIALGGLLLAAGAVNVDACPMEGFDAAVLDAELGLAEKGLTSVVLVALGYRGADDFNARLPKSRLAEEVLFTRL
ncbi:MAG: nitroreductase / dihydropteridine reductase [Pseudomonadota bacterium]|nr:nitroreductase / dihydropteridine reductase [Pseudomonadota bacterium]MDQ5903431.1 nitroreductase / dihydropteridine reductase [Pseudomonadota bacterium]MDQ5916590.1 nitroreductase / dihydropteridine reductase [Pseudomonadota bacterium]